MENSTSLKQQLILAGIDEIEQHGIQNFSLRRVAASCGVSCAAPYKHFADKQELISAVIEYIHDRWRERQKIVAEQYAGDSRRVLVEVSIAYIRFLSDNPQFRSVIMQRDNSLTDQQRITKSRMTEYSAHLVEKYCREVGMAEDVAQRKLFVVRALIYGASLFLDNGELPRNEATYEMISSMIDREFDLD